MALSADRSAGLFLVSGEWLLMPTPSDTRGSGWGDPERLMTRRPLAVWVLGFGLLAAWIGALPALFLSTFGDCFSDQCEVVRASMEWQVSLLFVFLPVGSIFALLAARGLRIAAIALAVVALPVAFLGVLLVIQLQTRAPTTLLETALPFVKFGYVIELPAALLFLIGSVLTLFGRSSP